MKYLALWLEAPLQSWGVDSRFDLRSTLEFPTKSGIFGLLLAASGDSGPQEALLARLGDCRLAVIVFRKSGTVDEPRLCDFHMVGSGYDDRDKWQTLLIPKTAEGKKAVGGGAKLTYRYYLQDRKFGAVLELPDDLAEKFDAALRQPVYTLYLGRKCCAPTDAVGRGVFATEEEAFHGLLAVAADKCAAPVRKIVEVPLGTPFAESFYDVPIRFGPHKIYRDRTVRSEPWPVSPVREACDGQSHSD